MKRPIASPIRVTLRPSRALRTSVLVLAAPAALAIHLSSLPDAPIALVPLLAWWAWRVLASGLPLTLVLRGDGSAVRLDEAGDEHPAHVLALNERGPFGTLALILDGRRRDIAWATDSLPRATRRELRLWMRDHAHSRDSSGNPTSTTG